VNTKARTLSPLCAAMGVWLVVFVANILVVLFL